MILIPAIDILDGNVVRVKQGNESTAKSYSSHPVQMAESFLTSGASLVHVVDLNAAIRNDRDTNRQIILEMISRFPRSVQVAGGIRKETDARKFLDAGAARVVLGSIAFEDPKAAKSVLDWAGPDTIVLALDYDFSGLVRTHGWKEAQQETIDAALARFFSEGFGQFLLTAIKQDGMLQGPDLENLQRLRSSVPKKAKLIASGGVSSEEDLKQLAAIGIDETIVGKAIYEGAIKLSLLTVYNSQGLQ